MTFNLNGIFVHKKKSFFIIALIFVLSTGLIAIQRTQRGSSDFDTYYHAGATASKGESPYYKDDYYEDYNSVAPFLYAPVVAQFFAIFALFPLPAAAFLWNLFLLFCFYVCVKQLAAVMHSRQKFIDLLIKAGTFNVFFAFLVLVVFLMDNLVMGQINILILLLCLFSITAAQSKKNAVAGFSLAAAILFKLTPALFVIYYLAKRKWKILFFTLMGILLFTCVIPLASFSYNNSRIYHRQWLGRTIKPTLIQNNAYLFPDEPHPRKKSHALILHDRLSAMLGDKNQTLEAMLTRMLLKNRNDFAFGSEPIYVAQRYSCVPVVAGGLELNTLQKLIKILQVSILGIMFILFVLKGPGTPYEYCLEMSLILVAMPLLSPIARSHQFISWAFFYFFVFIGSYSSFLDCPVIRSTRLRLSGIISFLLFIGQALPYGKVIGLAVWGNLLIFLTLCLEIIIIKLPEHKLFKSSEISVSP